MSGGSVAKKTVNILGRGQEIKNFRTRNQNIRTRNRKIKIEQNEYLESIEDILELSSSIERKIARNRNRICNI